jgi:prephenate dehydratase
MKKIGILGSEDSYSYLCYQKFIEKTHLVLEPVFYRTMHETFKHYTELDFLILPFENTLEGYVQQHMDLLFTHQLVIEAELALPISFDYIYKNQIKNLYVQYVTKNQCLSFIEDHHAYQIVLTDSNSESLEHYQKDPFGSAIIPHHLNQNKEQSLLDVADETSNHTRFLVLAQKPLELTRYESCDDYKISLVITPYKDRPGLLFDILKEFAEEKINLISIMSRPTKKQLGTYHFFIELISNEKDDMKTVHILERLKIDFDVRVLGFFQVL